MSKHLYGGSSKNNSNGIGANFTLDNPLGGNGKPGLGTGDKSSQQRSNNYGYQNGQKR
jgi:hypothetical protein